MSDEINDLYDEESVNDPVEFSVEEEGLDEGELDIPEGQRQAIMQPKDVTLFQYHRWYQQGRLNLNPDWQRDYVWKGNVRLF